MNKLSKLLALVACVFGVTLGSAATAQAAITFEPGPVVTVGFDPSGNVAYVQDSVNFDWTTNFTLTTDSTPAEDILITLRWASNTQASVGLTVASVTAADGSFDSGTPGATLSTPNGSSPTLIGPAYYEQVYALDLTNVNETTVVTFSFNRTGVVSGTEVSTVPEPATLVLLGTGLAGVIGARRRKRPAADK